MFDVLFVVLCLLCGAMLCLQNRESATPTSEDFQKFQRSYLIVYVCAVMGDWLQGPYVYALYAAYNFSKQQIAVLFIAGFGASGLLGTFVGEWADRHGRRLSCYVYCGTYILSCVTKHSANFYVLLFGRLTGGVATSILFSSFEAWLVAEHNKRLFPADWLNETLSLATLMNSLTAIVAAWLGALVNTKYCVFARLQQ